MILNIIFLAFILGSADSKTCKHDLPRQVIDQSKLNGEWYLTIHGSDAITTVDVLCFTLFGFAPTPNGWYMDSIVYTNKTSHQEEHVHILQTQTRGLYSIDKMTEKEMIRTKGYKANGKLNMVAKMEVDDMESSSFAYMTDYTTYFIHISCDINGEFLIWANTRKATPTPLEVVTIINALKEQGISQELHLGSCDKMDI